VTQPKNGARRASGKSADPARKNAKASARSAEAFTEITEADVSSTEAAAIGLHDRFRDISDRITRTVGSPIALISAIFLILLWAITGPIFGFSDSWQLLINTTTTIITFLMVFVIQTSQNRDGRAIQLKLDELIRSHSDARNELMATEKGPEETLAALEEEFEVEAAGHQHRRRRRTTTTTTTSRSSSPSRSNNRSGKRSTSRTRPS
jgi:low affinity Fe/Cu permease